MNDRAPLFSLWHPRYEMDGTRLTCLVDVSPMSYILLQDGDPELIAHFCDQLGLSGFTLTKWSLYGFNSPFYSTDIDAEEFDDWMSPAWRLLLVFEKWFGAPPEEPISPVPAWGYDRTWLAQRTPWDWNAHDTLVIALNGPESELDFLSGISRKLEVETVFYPRPKFTVSQLRISLGRVALPADADAVHEVALACHRQAMVVHVNASMSLMEQS